MNAFFYLSFDICFSVPPSDLLLRLGEHDLASEDEPYGFQERRVQIVASHPQFDPRTFEYDLALLRFYEPLLPFQPNTLPICLPDDDANYVGSTAHVTGWGRLYEGSYFTLISGLNSLFIFIVLPVHLHSMFFVRDLIVIAAGVFYYC